MEAMAKMPNKSYPLAIVDPQYGIGVNKMTLGNGKNKINRGNSDWDKKAPDSTYFDLLKRKSINQIIFGANHFIDNFPFNCNSSCWIVWDKGTGDNDYADGELAWTSFDSVLKIFKKSWVGANAKNETNRIHPTEKPVALYKWILKIYAKPGDKILDTHGGSMSIAIACYEMGFDLDLWEIDPDYYKAGKERFEKFKKKCDNNLFTANLEKGKISMKPNLKLFK
jgi:site-specific DNA-methyltransferase (adenine-specific)